MRFFQKICVSLLARVILKKKNKLFDVVLCNKLFFFCLVRFFSYLTQGRNLTRQKCLRITVKCGDILGFLCRFSSIIRSKFCSVMLDVPDTKNGQRNEISNKKTRSSMSLGIGSRHESRGRCLADAKTDPTFHRVWRTNLVRFGPSDFPYDRDSVSLFVRRSERSMSFEPWNVKQAGFRERFNLTQRLDHHDHYDL
jgi:hypothetical protein